jgi:hypothetical protein
MTSYNERLSFLGRLPYEPVSSSGNILTINFGTSDNFIHHLTENTTVTPNDIPTKYVAQVGVIEFIQDTTPRSVLFHTFFKFSLGVVPTATSTSGAKDLLFYRVSSDGTYAMCSWLPDVK